MQRAAQQLAHDHQGTEHVALHDEIMQRRGQGAVVEIQAGDGVIHAQADAGEGIGQTVIAQAQLGGLAYRGAAENGVTPGAIGGQVIAPTGLQAKVFDCGQRLDQVGDQLQLTLRFDLPVQAGQLHRAEPRFMQAPVQAQAKIEPQLREQLNAGDAAACWPGG